MGHSIITITGTDCVGKETQTKLLQEALKPSVRMSAPDYDHWAGAIIRSILQQKPFYIGTSLETLSGRRAADGGTFMRTNTFTQGKHPQILQLLHNINTWDKQERIMEGLKTHHWVMDRYIEDALAYGLIDGCSLDFLLELNRNFVQSDLVIVMLGTSYPRPGEVPDINEKDKRFQERVRETYLGLAKLFPNWRVIDTDDHQCTDIYRSIQYVHADICWVVSDVVGQTMPLNISQVEECVQEWQRK